MVNSVKKRFILLLAALAAAFLCLAALPRAARAEESAPPRPELYLPADGYVRFNDLMGMELDPGADPQKPDDDVLYLLDGKYLSRKARILSYKAGRMEVIAGGDDSADLIAASRPDMLARGGGYLFTYDRSSRKILAVSIADPTAIAELDTVPYLAGMTAIDAESRLYVSTGEAILYYDLTDLTAPAVPLVSGLNEAAHLSAYLADSAWQLLFDDQCEPRYGIHSVNTATGVLTHLNCDTFFTAATAVSAGSKQAYLSYPDGLYRLPLTGGKTAAEKVYPVSADASMTEGSLRQAAALCYAPGVSSLYIADDIAKSVQRFRVSADGSLHYDGLRLASFGSDVGKLDSPQDIAESGGKRYVLDTGNGRVQIFDREATVALPLSALGVPDTETASRISVDASGNIYVATEKALYKADAAGNRLAAMSVSAPVASIAHIDDTIYFTAGRAVYRLIPGATLPQQLRTLPEEAGSASAVCVDLKNETVYVAAGNAIYRFRPADTSDAFDKLEFAGTASDEAALDMDIDFKDTLFVLTQSAVYRVETAGTMQAERQALDLTTVTDGSVTIAAGAPRALALDAVTGEALLLYPNNHLAALLPKDVLAAATYSDIPVLAPPVDILDRQPNDGNTAPAYIAGWPSTILYPVSDSLIGTPNYPEGFCYTGSDILLLTEGTPVLLLGEVDNYYYVLYDNKAGFLLKNAITKPGEMYPSYTDALTLHDNVAVFKLPSTVRQGDAYAFEVTRLSKNTPITIVSKVADFADAADILWYKISYGEGNFGYIARENATQNVAWDNRGDERYGKVKADIAMGTVNVYDTTSADTKPFTQFKDAVRVRVLKDYGNGWLYVAGEDVTGQNVTGFVESKFVTFAALTTSQIVGICLLSSVAVLLIAALILFAIFKSRAKGRPTVK